MGNNNPMIHHHQYHSLSPITVLLSLSLWLSLNHSNCSNSIISITPYHRKPRNASFLLSGTLGARTADALSGMEMAVPSFGFISAAPSTPCLVKLEVGRDMLWYWQVFWKPTGWLRYALVFSFFLRIRRIRLASSAAKAWFLGYLRWAIVSGNGWRVVCGCCYIMACHVRSTDEHWALHFTHQESRMVKLDEGPAVAMTSVSVISDFWHILPWFFSLFLLLTPCSHIFVVGCCG